LAITTDLRGIYPPIPTPFNLDESIALDKLAGNIETWLTQSINGIVIPGSNSEAVYLTHEEKLHLWQSCADMLRSSGKRWIAGTGVETTKETIELTVQAADLGAEAALIQPPFFYKPALKHDVLLAHYFAVADVSPIPLLLYNVPVYTGIDFALETLVALATHPRIIGVKDSSANVTKMSALLAARPDFQVFCGTGSALLPFLSIGAVGGIMALANIAAAPLSSLIAAFNAGEIEAARHIQLSLVDINAAITSRYGISGLKYAMDVLGYYGGPTRRPLLPLADDAKAEIDRLINGIIWPTQPSAASGDIFENV